MFIKEKDKLLINRITGAQFSKLIKFISYLKFKGNYFGVYIQSEFYLLYGVT